MDVRKSFQKISEYFEEYFGHFRDVPFLKILKIFPKKSFEWCFENLENFFRKCWKTFMLTLRNISRNITEIFEHYFEKISKIIATKLENNFMKFCELYRKFLKTISKKFRRFREILRTVSRSISENFEKYLKEKFRIIFWKL